MAPAEIEGELDRAFAAYRAALGEEPRAMAAPGWIVTAGSLRAQDRRGLRYASDVRGPGVFRPVLDGYRSTTPQVGTTLPTLDELLGLDGVTEARFNDVLLERMAAEPGPHVYTLHAETEGMRWADPFRALLREVARRFDVRWLRVGELFDEASRAGVPDAPLEPRAIPGRSGLVACRATPGPSWGGSQIRG
jgi:undecaprenyl phosphate-alpha-L-ara4FN deformylase